MLQIFLERVGCVVERSLGEIVFPYVVEVFRILFRRVLERESGDRLVEEAELAAEEADDLHRDHGVFLDEKAELVGEDDEAWYVEAGAGENWHAFVLWTLARGWPGLENLALIPGTVGAAPVQNIGAYGLEVGELVARVRAWDFRRNDYVDYSREACRFAYRHSVFKEEGRHLDGSLAIVALTLRLPKRWQANCRYADVAQELTARGITQPVASDVAAAVIAVRQRKLPDPAVLPNAGSFFHNPIVSAAQAAELQQRYPDVPIYPQPDGRVKLAAGWLIEAAGWKGKALGPVGMYQKQALVLVNHGGASGEDVRRSMAAVQAAVRTKFAVELTPEPVFL